MDGEGGDLVGEVGVVDQDVGERSNTVENSGCEGEEDGRKIGALGSFGGQEVVGPLDQIPKLGERLVLEELWLALDVWKTDGLDNSVPWLQLRLGSWMLQWVSLRRRCRDVVHVRSRCELQCCLNGRRDVCQLLACESLELEQLLLAPHIKLGPNPKASISDSPSILVTRCHATI